MLKLKTRQARAGLESFPNSTFPKSESRLLRPENHYRLKGIVQGRTVEEPTSTPQDRGTTGKILTRFYEQTLGQRASRKRHLPCATVPPPNPTGSIDLVDPSIDLVDPKWTILRVSHPLARSGARLRCWGSITVEIQRSGEFEVFEQKAKELRSGAIPPGLHSPKTFCVNAIPPPNSTENCGKNRLRRAW